MVQDEGEIKHALDNDLERRVQAAKDKVVDSGAAHVMDEVGAAKIARAVRLQIELAGFAGMPQEIKANPNVVATVWPKIREYCALRIEIAMGQVVNILTSELGISSADVMTSISAGAPATGTPPVPGNPPAFGAQHFSEMSVEAARAGKLEMAHELMALAERALKL